MRLSLDQESASQTVAVPLVREYLVGREHKGWFIDFDGQRFGPYNSEREALLFAIDAAHTLGDRGEMTRVLSRDEAGELDPAWTFGHDPYPPGL